MKRFLSIVLAMLMLVGFFGCDALLTSTDREDLAYETKTIHSNAKLSINYPMYASSLEMLEKADRKEYGDLIDVERIKKLFEYDSIRMAENGKYSLYKDMPGVKLAIRQLRNGETLDYKIYEDYSHHSNISVFEDYKEYTARVDISINANILKFVKEGVDVYLFPQQRYENGYIYYTYDLIFRIENYVFYITAPKMYYLLENGTLPTLEDLENQKSEYDSKALTTFYELTNFYNEESELIRMLKQEVWVAGIPIATE